VAEKNNSESKVQELEQLLETANKKIALVEGQNADLVNNLEETQEALEAEKTAHEATKAELENTVAVNSELAAEVAKLSEVAPVKAEAKKATPGVSNEVFEVDGKQYGFVFAKVCVKLPGSDAAQPITAEEVLASKELQQQLIGMGSNMIKQL